jgi:hypothetical protein
MFHARFATPSDADEEEATGIKLAAAVVFDKNVAGALRTVLPCSVVVPPRFVVSPQVEPESVACWKDGETSGAKTAASVVLAKCSGLGSCALEVIVTTGDTNPVAEKTLPLNTVAPELGAETAASVPVGEVPPNRIRKVLGVIGGTTQRSLPSAYTVHALSAHTCTTLISTIHSTRVSSLPSRYIT